MRAISKQVDIGMQRETFFVNQIKSSLYNKASILDENILLDTHVDFKIPLWLFGFLY